MDHKGRNTAVSLGGYSRRDGDDLSHAVYALAGALILTTLSSIIHSAASIDTCVSIVPLIVLNGTCTEVFGFSVALGIISTISMLGFFLVFRIERFRDKLPEKTLYWVSIGLLVWWSLGVGITTFQVTTIPDTRYFACWVCLLSSAYVAHSEFEQFSLMIDRVQQMDSYSRSTLYLALASLIECVSAVFACVDMTCASNEIFGIVSGLISLGLSIALLRYVPRFGEDATNRLSVALVVFWTISLCVLTLNGPFKFASNGFFSCWAAFLLSLYIAQGRLFPFADNFASEIVESRRQQSMNAKNQDTRDLGVGVQYVTSNSDLNTKVNRSSHAFLVANPHVSVASTDINTTSGSIDDNVPPL